MGGSVGTVPDHPRRILGIEVRFRSWTTVRPSKKRSGRGRLGKIALKQLHLDLDTGVVQAVDHWAEEMRVRGRAGAVNQLLIKALAVEGYWPPDREAPDVP